MHESDFALAILAIQKGADVSETVRVMQDAWNVPLVRARLRKADDEDSRSNAGDHPIDAIGRQEQAFYDALTDGQKDAYKSLKQLVEAMFENNGGSWAGIDPWAIGDPVDEWKRKVFNDLATRPMQAFLVGQMLAQDHIESGLPRPMLPTDRRAIEFLDHYAFNEIDDAFNSLKSDLRTMLIQGMQEGENPVTIARRFATTLEDYDTNWDLISITETARAESQGRLHELGDEDYEYAIGSSAHDDRTCDDCLRLVNDVVVKVADTIGVSNYGNKKAEWVTCIPLHPRCRCVWLPFVP